jgi:hypothetical protein
VTGERCLVRGTEGADPALDRLQLLSALLDPLLGSIQQVCQLLADRLARPVRGASRPKLGTGISTYLSASHRT